MIKSISPLSVSSDGANAIHMLEKTINQAIKTSPSPFRDGEFHALDNQYSEHEYGLGRFSPSLKNKVLPSLMGDVHITVNHHLGKTLGDYSPDDIDLIVFGTVDEHIDDEGERCLVVLSSANGFEMHTEDENGDPYSIPLTERSIVLFDEGIPHSVTRYDFLEPTIHDTPQDYSIALSFPQNLLLG